VIPSNLGLFLFQLFTSIIYFNNPQGIYSCFFSYFEGQEMFEKGHFEYFSFEDPFHPVHPYGNSFESLSTGHIEKFSFDGKNSNYDYFSQYDKSMFGLGLESTQFLMFLQLLKFAQLYTLIHDLEKK
jgi:hypothetical protein